MNTSHEPADRPGTPRAAGAGADPAAVIRGWFLGRLPGDWFTGDAEVLADREEITVIGPLPAAGTGDAAEATAGEATAGGAGSAGDAGAGDAERFREESRETRMAIAREAETLFGRKVSWGVRCESRTVMFTTLSVPVMTRLRQPERRVLDTLVDAGVARSRSDALAWCVRLVGQHELAWLGDLRVALRHVEEVRAGGPRS
jgi:hypothetical protein